MATVLWQAATQVFSPTTLIVILLASSYGILVGSIPGLTATMAVALMVPLTFFLDDTAAIAAIVSTVTCSIFAGDIPATLVRIPGTPASAAYVNDAYRMSQQGHAGRALGVSLIWSILGGLFGTVVLAGAAPLLARLATQFTSYEYFWLYVLGLSCAAIVSEQSRLKGMLALLIGLLFSTVGLGTDYSTPRLTFGIDALITGISFIPAMIGLFGLSEVLRNVLVLSRRRPTQRTAVVRQPRPNWWQPAVEAWSSVRWPGLLRGSSIGSIIGMLPGAGADIAAWISYAVSKRLSAHPEEYGQGSTEGLGNATAANNAALGSAWIPALVFGIPGDSVTAIAIGVLFMKNITPGPNIFELTDPVTPQTVLVYGIFITFVLVNLIMLPLGLIAIRIGSALIRIPRRVLLPLVVLFCVVGSYALNASYFDVVIMLVMGVLGFVFERFRIPLGPVVLGILLGAPLEHKFLQCLAKSTDAWPFFASPISAVLAGIVLLMWVAPLGSRRRKSSPSSNAD